MIETPCINICTLEPQAGICIGCGRTLDEIARWGTMTDEQRKAVMTVLGERLKTISAPASRRQPRRIE